MSIQMIYGRANSGKTDYVLNKALELYNQNQAFVMVVPEQYTHIAEKKLISKIGSIEQGRAEVLSFDRIATRINSVYGSAKKHLNSIAKKLIISEIMSETPLYYYKNVLKDSGFADICINEISELKKYNITSLQLTDIATKVDDYTLSLKLKDLAEIYCRYDNLISGKYADSDDLLGILCDNLNLYSPYSGYTFIFDEFSSFNPKEKNIISSLAKQCKSVYITLCADLSHKYRMLFKPTLNIAKSIVEECESLGIEVIEPVVLTQTRYSSAEMKFLEENIYSYPCNIYPKETSDISMDVYDSAYSEISGLAFKINKIVSEKGIRYRDINIVCADIDSYSHIIKNVFKKYDIPYFIDEKTSVLKHSIASYVINILDVYLNNYKSEYLTEYLKSGYVNIERETLICADNFINATNSSKNTWLNEERWKSTVEKYCEIESEHIETLKTIREKYIIPLAKFHEKIKGKNTVKFICDKLYNYLLETKFDKQIIGYMNTFRKENNKYLEKQYELVWKNLIDVLDTMVQILGDKKVSISEYRKYLYISLQEQQIGIIPTSLDAVVIGDVKRSKSDSSDYQFIIGVIDGVFPSSVTNNSFLTDSDKKLVEQMGVHITPDSHEKAIYERFLAYCVLSKASCSLTLSYPVVDSGLNSVRPSFLMTIIKNVFPDIKINSYVNNTDKLLLLNKKDSLEFFSNQIYKLKNGKPYDNRWKDLYKFYNDECPENICLIDNIVSDNKQITKLDTNLIDKLYYDEFYSTISRLQRYNSCRYSYFLEYILGLKEKCKSEPESTDIGTFIHACIEKTFLALNSTGKSITDATDNEILNILKIIFDECTPLLFKYDDELTPASTFLLNSAKVKVIKAIIGIKSHFVGSAFVPIGHEISFDDDNGGCIELILNNNKKLKLVGKIDRADSFENEDGIYIRVVDYKSGSKTFSLSDVFYGLDVQLIVYLNTLIKNTENAHHAGALFFTIQNSVDEFAEHPSDDVLNKLKLRSNAMNGMISNESHVVNAYSPGSLGTYKDASPSQFSALSDYVENLLIKSATDLSNGCIELNPYTKSSTSPCVYCSYAGICKFDDGVNGNARKLGSVTAKSFWENVIKTQNGGDE